MSLASYIHRFVVKRSKFTERKRRRMDKEFFMRKMEQERGWKVEQSLAEWERLESDATNFADNRGPEHCPKRLKIRAHLLCEDYSGSGTEVEESKELQKQTSDIKNLKQEDEEAIKTELQTGFSSQLRGPSSQSALLAPTPASGYTFEGNPSSMTVSSMLKRHLGAGGAPAIVSATGPGQAEAATAPAIGGAAAGSGAATAASLGPVPPQSSPLKDKGDVFDLGSARAAAHRSVLKEFETLERKVIVAASGLASTLSAHVYTKARGEEEYHMCMERLVVCYLFLSQRPSVLERDGKREYNYDGLAFLTLKEVLGEDGLLVVSRQSRVLA